MDHTSQAEKNYVARVFLDMCLLGNIFILKIELALGTYVVLKGGKCAGEFAWGRVSHRVKKAGKKNF